MWIPIENLIKFIGIFILLLSIRAIFMLLTKKINMKLACIDSWIYVIYFAILSLFSIVDNPPMEALLVLFSLFIIPILYIFFKKKYFIKNNMYAGIYYPVIEFLVIFLSISLIWLFSHLVSK